MLRPMKLPDRNLLIDGEWVPALSGETFTTTNPATEAVSGVLAKAAEPDVDRAALAARRAAMWMPPLSMVWPPK